MNNLRGQGKSTNTFSAERATFSAFHQGGYAVRPRWRDSREGGQDTGVGRSTCIQPNSSMQYKDPQEPPKLEISGKRRKTYTLVYPDPNLSKFNHLYTFLCPNNFM
jgi:hypothetical protein